MKRITRLIPVVGLVVGLAFGWLVYPHLAFEAEPLAVPFSHLAHVGEDVGMECGDCHDHGRGRSLAMPAMESCLDCHDAIPGIDATADELLAIARPWVSRLEQPEGVRFGHPQHVELAGLECATCHGDHGQSTMSPPVQRNRISQYARALWGRDGLGPARATAGMEMADCVRCHREQAVVQSCLDCHR
jgi:menaquinone reductase, multiheme cytochrome c subunit